MDPPLKEIPEGDWFCPSCAASKKPAAAAKAGAASKQHQEIEDSEEDDAPVEPQSRRGRRRTLVTLDSSGDEDDFADAAVTVRASTIQIKDEPGRWGSISLRFPLLFHDLLRLGFFMLVSVSVVVSGCMQQIEELSVDAHASFCLGFWLCQSTFTTVFCSLSVP